MNGFFMKIDMGDHYVSGHVFRDQFGELHVMDIVLEIGELKFKPASEKEKRMLKDQIISDYEYLMATKPLVEAL